VAAYVRDVSGFLRFLAEHHGGAVTADTLRDLDTGGRRAWMAAERRRDLGPRSRARVGTASAGPVLGRAAGGWGG